MPEAWLRKLMLIAVTSAVLAAMVRVLRGGPAPQFAGHNEAPGGTPPVLVAAPTDPTVSLPAPATEPTGIWAEPIGGACPPGFPVKAKLTSGIFHVPGGLSYDRTNPDRCYPTPEGAVADGLRAAKR